MESFNLAIQRELETDVAGMPWSLRTYVERRLRFAQDQEAEERFIAILCRLHTLHLAGPENWWRVGATIAQAFKSLEHYTRERDWQLAWLWLDTPDPRPRAGMARGLADPVEHSAAVAFLREAHLLEAQRQAVAGRVAWPAAASGDPSLAVGGVPAGGLAAPAPRQPRRRAARPKAPPGGGPQR